MSENKLEPVKYPPDMDPKEVAVLEEFVNEGLPLISKVDDNSILEWFNLYLAGKSYLQIAENTKSKIEHILYIANKFKWHERKMNHYNNVLGKIEQRVLATKVESAEFLLDVITFFHKKHGTKINDFIKTGKEDLLKNIHLGELDKYYKSLDALQKVLSKPLENPNLSPSAPPANPAVHIHIGDSTVQKKEDGSLTITSLKDVANKKRNEQK